MPAVTDSSTLSTREFRVGDWWSRPTIHRLERGEERAPPEPTTMDVLVVSAVYAIEHLEREAPVP